MERRRFLANLLLVSLLPAFIAPLKADGDSIPDRPNVVFIMGDDMRQNHFGFINGKALTPNLDRMAADGCYFSRTYIPSAACTPTRFSSLTGRLASRCNSQSFKNSATPEGVYAVSWNTNLNYEADILSRVMKDAGYTTGIVGKWHNGSSGEFSRIKNLFHADDDPADPAVAANLEQLDEEIQKYLRGLGFEYVEGVVMGNYSDHPLKALRYHNQEVITKFAVDFIKQNRDRPFFLYMPTTLMHGPSPWKSLNGDPLKTYSGLLDHPVNIQPSRQDVISRGRNAGISDNNIPVTWLDDGIGVVLNTLEELGLDSSTMVIFMNDQGIDGGKASCYEGGVRVPSMIYWPGRITPGSSDALVENIDLYPTICEACGIEIDSTRHDGISLWPIINGDQEELRDHVYCEWGYTRAIVTKEWKYLAFRLPPSKDLTYKQKVEKACKMAEANEKYNRDDYIPMPSEPISHSGIHGGYGTERLQAMISYPYYYDRDQLYYLPDDPDEHHNLAGLAGYSDKLEELKVLLEQWVEEMPGNFGEF